MSGKKVDPVTGEAVVAEVVSAALAPAKRQGDVVSQYLYTDDERVKVDPTDVHKAIIEEIMASTTAEELFADTDTDDLSEYVGRVIEVRDFSVNDSEFETGAPIYLAIKVTDVETGERRIITTGEQNVMAQLILAKQRGWLPAKLRPTQARRMNRHNRYPIRLVKVED